MAWSAIKPIRCKVASSLASRQEDQEEGGRGGRAPQKSANDKKKKEDFLNSNFTHTIFLIHYWIQMIFFSIPQIMKHLSFLFVLENTQFLQNQIQLSIKKKHIFVAKIYAFNLFFFESFFSNVALFTSYPPSRVEIEQRKLEYFFLPLDVSKHRRVSFVLFPSLPTSFASLARGATVHGK